MDETLDRLAAELHGLVRAAVDADLADQVEDHVLAIRYDGNSPSNTKRIVGGTFTSSFPVPRMNAASVLPMPVAN